ncbi:hypothetical protein [Burkholderia ubonensis]|uniref:Uncharacterized protein n=1 Tax=Burkholderia ubonensis subsp. mesacidophila TaxID=265293 RepID=A0A2A4FAK1_9BURK|nr:hypothetical protein [Burkholderia ubonensis]PCE30047.1 hypothetical protein BZL54_23060 [Burkholderia ubonensis subsp. mesacidophila]
MSNVERFQPRVAAAFRGTPQRTSLRAVPDKVSEAKRVLERCRDTERAATLRERADTLTLAYIAIGARDAIRSRTAGISLDRFDGELGLVERAVAHVKMLDSVADWFDARGGHPRVFEQEVAECFGYAFAADQLMRDACTETDAQLVLVSVMLAAGYREADIDTAIADIAVAQASPDCANPGGSLRRARPNL